jgi:hypothetical protein
MTQHAPMVDTLAASWLALQCQMIPKVHRGAVYLGVGDKADPTATARWPEGSPESPALHAATKLVLDRQCPVLCGDDATAEISRADKLNIACPLIVEGRFTGVVAVEVDGASEQQQRAVMQLLQWGSTWLEFLVRREASSVTNSLMTATRAVAICLEHHEFQAAATATATELAMHLQCERVSIGFLDGRRVAVRAISHSANFNTRTNLARDLEGAMEEALAQGDVVVFPSSADTPLRMTAQHAALARNENVGQICTVPIGDTDDLCGAIVFERAREQPFDASALELCEVIGSLLGPILELKRKESRWVGAVLRDDFSGFLRRALGRGHAGIKLALLCMLALIGYLSIATGDYRVTADATIEGTVQRVIVAPMDGYVAGAAARAGDLVRKGEVLGHLEDQELQLEYARWAGQREQYKTEYRQALARRDRSQTRVLNAQLAQANAQLQLIEQKLARTELVAPFDGLVVSGDLSQQYGSPVERGEVLFEVAPIDSYRVILEVDEREIAGIREGQHGQLAVAALSGEVADLVIDKITPVSSTADGHNFFRVEASLASPLNDLRPGMLGVGKVTVGERKLIEIWTRSLVDWFRLALWSWWP